jgi:hypothetical protein
MASFPSANPAIKSKKNKAALLSCSTRRAVMSWIQMMTGMLTSKLECCYDSQQQVTCWDETAEILMQ